MKRMRKNVLKALKQQTNRTTYKKLKREVKMTETPEDLAFRLLDNEQEKVFAHVFPRVDVGHYFSKWADVSYDAAGNIAQIQLNKIQSIIQDGISARGSNDINNLPAYDDMIEMTADASLDELFQLRQKHMHMLGNIMEELDRRDAEAREQFAAIKEEQAKLRQQLIDIHGDDPKNMDPGIAKLLFPDS